MSYKGKENPIELECFRLCTSCYRCEDKGRYAKCEHCSGRNDPTFQRDPEDIDDYCRCAEGVLQYRTKIGRMIIRRFPSNPFKGKVASDIVSQDERDWNQYVGEQRERFDDPTWDPIKLV